MKNSINQSQSITNSLKNNTDHIVAINWNEIIIKNSNFNTNSSKINSISNSNNDNQSNKSNVLLGQGSFGAVIKAYYKPNHLNMSSEKEVAIKVFAKSAIDYTNEFNYDQIKKDAWKEANILINIWRNVENKNSIVRVYGIVEGQMPSSLTSLFHLQNDEEGVGIVMRYEPGGSLENLLHIKNIPLNYTENIRILREISRGLFELHSIGVIHADLKPANILLSHHNPPEIRLADFGVSILSQPFELKSNDNSNNSNNDNSSKNKHNNDSTLRNTKSARGTPIYRAPEMLVNPMNVNFDETVASASRKTDMYAFALVTWEVLTRLVIIYYILNHIIYLHVF
jgi:serine/threonine protein kinase